jgi:outer membrane protein OmpA-like peptidoglycan-associated protein
MDPETRQTRVVNPLLDGPSADVPQNAYQAPIILKKPKPHKRKAAAPKPASAPPPSPEPQTEEPAQASPAPSGGSPGADDYVSPFSSPAPEPKSEPKPAAKPAPKPAPKKVTEKPKPAAEPEPAQGSAAIPFSFGAHDNDAAPAPSQPQQQATVAPPPSPGKAAGSGVRNIHINFEPGQAEPSADVAAALQSLAGSLTSALQAKSGRLLLQAFAGMPGDKSSEARRLSLKRALAVRQLLIDSGVPSDRIDVRAMGGITDGGQPDRVDVMLRG